MVAKKYLLGTYLLFSACTPHVGIQKSNIATPVTWNTPMNFSYDNPLVVDRCLEVEQHWWAHFKDETLNVIIAQALQNNKTLAIAKTRIEEAKAIRLANWSELWPQINGTGSVSKGNQGFSSSNEVLAFKTAALEANWEVDFFGKNQAHLGAANAIVQSETFTRQAIIVGLLAEVARNYFDLINYKRQINITKKNLQSQKKTFELTKEQFAGGLASDFDVQRAGALVSDTEARIPLLEIAYEMASNRLNVLLGDTPGLNDLLFKSHEKLEPLDQNILIAAPATVLATRPDVRAAERRFAASIYEHQAAIREIFPTISLMSFFGIQHSTLLNTAPLWNIAANLVLPLIDFGKIQSNIRLTGARQCGAYLEYQETVLNAVEDMENALANYFYEIARNQSLKESFEQNNKARQLADEQYTNGYTALIDVLIVERNTLDSESLFAESDAKLRKDLVNIYTASGGGWAY